MNCSYCLHQPTKELPQLIVLPILFAFILTIGVASAQMFDVQKVVLFKDGTTITGNIVEMNIYTVKIQTAGGSIVTRKFDDVVSIDNREALPSKTNLLPVHSMDIGLEAFYKEYKEPDLNVKETGMMYGVAFGYTYHDKVMAKAQLLIAYGSVDYSNSGKISGIPDNQWELRGLLGYDVAVDPTSFITPYTGLGYRYLGDDSSGRISTTGAHGYNRQSNYWYSPIGIEYVSILPDGWTIGAGAEFDIFWSGTQKSFLSNANPSLPDVSNQQNQGYGFRGAIRVEKKFTYTSIKFEPFIRYWNIGQSEDTIAAGRLVYEPKNNTTEIGAQIAIKF